MAGSVTRLAPPADQHGIALLGKESAAGEVAHERLIDRRALELEVIEVLGERQLGDGELVLDRARLLEPRMVCTNCGTPGTASWWHRRV
jgi:hypothetical protein